MAILLALPGADELLNKSYAVDQEAMEEDREEEIECYNAVLDAERTMLPEDLGLDDNDDFYEKRPQKKSKGPVNRDHIDELVKEKSRHVVVAHTQQEYARYWQQFIRFCVEVGFIENAEDIETMYPNFSAELPKWITVWIMDKCDDTDIRTNKLKDPSIPRPGIGTAQKMRASMTHKFGREFGLGTQHWIESPLEPGRFMGNPSISVMVTQYMVSLSRRKVRAGEVASSARAIDEAGMKLLWTFLSAYPKTEPIVATSRKRKGEDKNLWGGYRVRTMLHLLYTLSMLCLLRYDEALRIMWTDVTLITLDNGTKCIKLMLPFRKTCQNGDILPFYLFALPDQPWLCPVLAFAQFIKVCQELGIQQSGYIFRKKTSESFLEFFRNNLLDVGIDPRPYGTHSFRRGGCQFLSLVKRWPLREICAWGGWAADFDNPGTIFKYLLSFHDNPFTDRMDFFNPNRKGTEQCTGCGRTCHCA